MEISFTLFLDPSGFIRRECPSCERQFKWFHGQTENYPDDFLEPENYHCPYCGIPSDKSSWWTPEQLEHAASVATGPIMNEITRGLSGSLGKGIKFKANPASTPEPTPPPIDPDDMIIVEPPCHPFEPLKVEDEWIDPIHCLMCGERFRV